MSPEGLTTSKSLLELHRSGECTCSKQGKRKDCIYQEFPDGWSFVPDRGLGKDTGEIFTPVPLINQILSDTGIFPDTALYESRYSARGATKRIGATVCDQACGTGNFFIVVLSHKLNYCRVLFEEKDSDPMALATNMLIAASSLYAYDIDPGNLEILKRRTLSHGKQPLDDYKAINYWSEYQDNRLNGSDYERRGERQVPMEEIRMLTSRSLASAQEYWGENVSTGRGMIDSLYRDLVGERMPEWFYWQTREILDKNVKLFDGLSERNIITRNEARPGIESVKWTEWSIVPDEKPGRPPFIREIEHPMSSQMTLSV
jgi:hypothetical protein